MAELRLKSINTKTISVFLILTLMMFWEILGRIGVISSLFFPVPSRVIWNLIESFLYGEMGKHASISVIRIFFGVVIGGGSGFTIGFFMGRLQPLREVLDPILAIIHPLPKIAVYPLIIIILGIGEVSRSFIIALSAFFPVAITTMAAAADIPRDYIDIARSYGAGSTLIFRRILWPACIGPVLTGLRLSLNAALLITVSAEMISAPDGLGWLIERAWRTYRITDLYTTLLLISIIGGMFRIIVQTLILKIAPWSTKNDNH